MKEVKEKRYLCDYFDSNDGWKLTIIMLLALIAVFVISSIIKYNLIINKYGHELDLYCESDCEELEKVSNDIVKGGDIDLSVIPKNIKYEVKDDDSYITVTLYSVNNDKKKYAPLVSESNTILKDKFRIVSKSLMTEENYKLITRNNMIGMSVVFGLILFIDISICSILCLFIAYVISRNNKKKAKEIERWY